MNFHHFKNIIVSSKCNMGVISDIREKDPLSKICAMNNFEPACVCFLKKDVSNDLMTVFNSGIEYIYTDCLSDQLFDYSRHFPVPKAESYMLQVLNSCPGVQEEGIFCDIAGTLLYGKNKINEKMLNTLKEREMGGHKITLWTGGGVKTYADILKESGVDWPIVSKYDYRGKRISNAYDNENKESLYRKYGISITDLTVV